MEPIDSEAEQGVDGQKASGYDLGVPSRNQDGKQQERKQQEYEQQILTDADYVLASPVVYGFALADKKWVEFNVDLVEDIVWNDSAFSNLVLPPEKKALIQALVVSHGKKGRRKFDDFIVGKGQGLVIKFVVISRSLYDLLTISAAYLVPPE